MDNNARASMSSAPDAPLKPARLHKPFFILGLSSGRQAVHVINYQSSQNQMSNFFI
ncbi:hypothetical protein [Providencia sp. PROV132]|uniref:hypothetical protein n=1 Tax=Providencia sp. PROV132 TaxID=2949842 RepID=UPI00234BB347|nr:hypothetical protein [Providencia sp. PROV132]